MEVFFKDFQGPVATVEQRLISDVTSGDLPRCCVRTTMLINVSGLLLSCRQSPSLKALPTESQFVIKKIK